MQTCFNDILAHTPLTCMLSLTDCAVATELHLLQGLNPAVVLTPPQCTHPVSLAPEREPQSTVPDPCLPASLPPCLPAPQPRRHRVPSPVPRSPMKFTHAVMGRTALTNEIHACGDGVTPLGTLNPERCCAPASDGLCDSLLHICDTQWLVVRW